MRSSRRLVPVILVLGCLGAGTTAEATAPGARARYRFANVTTAQGLYQETRTWGSAWTDYDEDGDPDLFVVRHWRTPRMFVNEGGGQGYHRLRKQTDLQGTQMDRHQCVWGEANHDGRPDLFCTQGADKGQGRGPKQLLINRDGNLREEARQWGVADPLTRGRSANWIDFDGDLDLDLFSGSTLRKGHPNKMFRRVRKGFEPARVGVADELETVSSSWADWDRDGDPDLLVLQHHPFRPVVYKNTGGRFKRIRIKHISGRSWQGASWADFDGDGQMDLHLVNRRHSLVLRNTPRGMRPVHRMRLVQGRMSVWFDVDNDGDLDLFVVQGARGDYPQKDSVNRRDFLLLNQERGFKPFTSPSLRGPRVGNGDAVSAADHNRDGRVDLFVTNGLYHFTGPNQLLENRSEVENWIGVDLDGADINPLGIGARILVGAGDLKYWRDVTDGVSFRSQSEVGYVHLGIGQASAATINVYWPDGTLDCVTVPANTILRVQQQTLPCA